MIVSLIAAVDLHGLIGDGAGLPWHLPRDLRRFRASTLGKPVIMGRKTYASLGRPLPQRYNIVLSREAGYDVPGCVVARTLDEALLVAGGYLAEAGTDEAMIIGGGTVYEQALPHWDRLYLTVVHGRFTGATYFPVRELLRQRWRPAREPETCPADEKNAYAHSFFVLERDWEAERLGPPRGGEEECPTEVDLLAALARGTSGR
jgi:dihydrofolate reductase